ncbi:MAG: glycosyltransferase family 39 protein, partial [Candidatus Kuenenbacteria bacterium]
MKIDKILLLILFAALVLWLWNVGSVDLVGDDGLYSFRALGYYDSLAAGEQTAPIQWFGHIPVWANLSFHDAPPLVFAVQKISFTLFGDNPLAARLPFILAGLAVLYVLFLINKQIFSRQAALLTAVLMAVMSFSVWMADTGFLEGILILFIALSLFFWIKFITSQKNFYLYFWSASVGMALITKYTALFILPLFFIHMLVYKRKIFKAKELYLGLLIVFLILSPVIIYNVKVFQTRGHFDAALSSMLGIHSDDFLAVGQRGVSFDFFNNFLSVFRNLSNNFSPLLLIFFYLSLFYLCYAVLFKKNSKKISSLILLGFAFILLMFSFSGCESRFLPVLIPFIIIAIAYFISSILKLLDSKKLFKHKKIFIYKQ